VTCSSLARQRQATFAADFIMNLFPVINILLYFQKIILHIHRWIPNKKQRNATTAEQQSPRLQQVKTWLKCNSHEHKNKGKNLLTFRRPQVHRNLQQAPPYLHCQPLNEVWEGVNPGSIPFNHSGTLDAPELPWAGPAFSPGAQSLLQALT